MMQKYLLEKIDFKFDIRRNSSFDSYLTPRSNDLHLPPSKEWNNLDNDIKTANHCPFFKASLKSLKV